MRPPLRVPTLLGLALLLLLVPGLPAAGDETGLDLPEGEDVEEDASDETPEKDADAAPEDDAQPAVEETPWHPVVLLGEQIAPGERRRIFMRASESFVGAAVDLPILVQRGTEPGPTACLIAGIHGDELNGIEIVREAFERVKPDELSGMLLGVPVANLHGFRRSSRYLPDRRDLNRYFPGHPAGSSASRIANALFEGVIRHCEALVDFHTGSFHRANLPQVRADLHRERVVEVARAFGAPVIVHSEGTRGTLRRAATEAGVPSITYEAGEPMRFQREEVAQGVEGVFHWLSGLGMRRGSAGRTPAERTYYRSRWVRVNDGGIFLTGRDLGERIGAGEILGTVTDPVSNERSRVIAPFSGRIIGMALSQVVIPGFAAFHIGVETEPLAMPPSPDDEVEDPGELDLEEHPE